MTKQSRAHKGSGMHGMLSVYDGQRCLGHLIRRGKCGVEAFDVEDRSLGVFSSQYETIEAVMVARKRPWSTPALTEITDPEVIAVIRRDAGE